MTSYWAEHALLPTGPAEKVRLEEQDGRWMSIMVDQPHGDARRLPGVIMPGFANCHSHAFHRALRGRARRPAQGADFWSWREAMYSVAERLDPDSYLALARATYAEMALAGITAVGEFHYLHHGPVGTPYADPNAMAEALRQAAVQAGIRLTLLDTCYLSGGLTESGHQPLSGPQQRFGDADAQAWAERMITLRPDATTMIGAAIHSVRAVPAEQLPTVVAAAEGGPLHVHLSEQLEENRASRAFHGRSPTSVLSDAGALGPRTTAVHATHLDQADIRTMGESGATVCLCPTTEADLADGIGPARLLADSGAPLALGTDQHVMIDFFAETRALEWHERLATGVRDRFTPSELLAAATAHSAIGWPEAGRLEVGARADAVAVINNSARTAGGNPEHILLVAGAADVHTVIRDGEVIVEDHHHRQGDVGALLADAIEPLWRHR